jgi:hypothetical protein
LKEVGFRFALIDAYPRMIDIGDLVIAIKGNDNFVRVFMENF